jgi:NAD(P)-dependent dehydrogenase (short-subunit alcohol dehydrogenase family)
VNRIALVTGSSRGIGREVARQLAARDVRVVVTSRGADAAAEAAAKIGRGAVGHVLDTADAQSIEAIGRFVEAELGRLDILVNNAGILLDEGKSIVDVEPSEFEETWRLNTLGPFLLTKRFAPLLRKSGHGRVVNVSSGAGQLSSMSGYAPSYSTSKAALNAVTILFANALRGDRVLVNCADPGWVRTDMGGRAARRRRGSGDDRLAGHASRRRPDRRLLPRPATDRVVNQLTFRHHARSSRRRLADMSRVRGM